MIAEEGKNRIKKQDFEFIFLQPLHIAEGNTITLVGIVKLIKINQLSSLKNNEIKIKILIN